MSVLAMVLAGLALVLGWWLGRGQGREQGQKLGREQGQELGKAAMAADLAASQQRAGDLDKRLAERENELSKLREQVSAAEQKVARAEAQAEAAQQAIANERKLLDEAQKKLTDTFKALATEALTGSQKQFLTLATEKFDAKQQAIDTLLKPVKETLGELQKQTQQLEIKREGAYKELGQQLTQLSSEQARLQQAAQSLSSALRDTRTTGQWGEIVLRRVVELAGMTEHCDFSEQQTQDDGRPDLIVHLPNGRTIIVDAKTSVKSFLEAAETPDEALRQQKLKEHARNIRTHALGLAKRKYEKSFEDAIDLTVCFIPGDVYYFAALQTEPGLFEEAANAKIVFATPTTLIALLKAAAFGWQQDSLRREAKEILKQAQTVYERLVTATGHLAGLGKNLNRSVESYDKFIGSLEGSVLPAARRMKELGLKGEEIESIEPLSKSTRTLQARDWTALQDNLALAASAESVQEE